jgi:hypothetical protein
MKSSWLEWQWMKLDGRNGGSNLPNDELFYFFVEESDHAASADM